MITDDQLLLYHYRDGLDASERARIGTALSQQPELAQRMQTLVSRLDAAAVLPEVPVPAEVRERWSAALENASQNDTSPDSRAARAERRWDFRWAAAAAVAAVAVFLAFPERPTEIAPPAETTAAASESDATAYERGLKFHLASTERQIAGLDSASPAERARLIETIIAQNRIYALAAERAGEPQLARVLRAFSPVLESLAQDGGDASADIAQLSFELRVMQGRLSAAADTPSTTL
jgi:hypothetical protein